MHHPLPRPHSINMPGCGIAEGCFRRQLRPDYEFATHTKRTDAVWHAPLAEEPPKPATALTVRGVTRIFSSMFHKISPALTSRFEQLEKRVAAIEHASGISAMAKSLASVEKSLRAPVLPVYDARGKLIGAKREIAQDDDDVASRVSLLEHRAARHAEHLKSLEKSKKVQR